jgi:SAM-dependent methyltransferase
MNGTSTHAETAAFLVGAARDVAGVTLGDGFSVLDFGCGRGDMVGQLRGMGVNALGCDFADSLGPGEGLHAIERDAYRLPFPDKSFDLVVSICVFEHAQDTHACMAEIHRVLRDGGVALHMIPGKWYLPTEPHIHVPLVNWFWPFPQRPWLALWAIAGVRNAYQRGLSWREVTRRNVAYARDGLCYRTTGHYDKVSRRIFGNSAWPMDYVIQRGTGGSAALARRLPMKRLTGWAIREFRVGLLMQRRVAE